MRVVWFALLKGSLIARRHNDPMQSRDSFNKKCDVTSVKDGLCIREDFELTFVFLLKIKRNGCEWFVEKLLVVSGKNAACAKSSFEILLMCLKLLV